MSKHNKKQKQNPLLASYEAQFEARYRTMLRQNCEINMIASLIAANNVLQVGPGRAGTLLDEHVDITMQIAMEILAEDDPELLYTKHNLATRLKSVLGPDNWKKYRELFPLLREYWD